MLSYKTTYTKRNVKYNMKISFGITYWKFSHCKDRKNRKQSKMGRVWPYYFFPRILTCLPVHNIIIRDIVTLRENLLVSYALTSEFLKQKLHDISLILSLIDFITQRNTEQLHSSLISNCTMAYTYKCSVVFFGKRKVYNHS